MDLAECRKNKLVKDATHDKNLFNSLIKSSSRKLKTEEHIKLDDESASSKISLAYDSLRELLEALAISKGFKVYNHECYCAFLKEVLNESYLADKFDEIRKLRNSINYYGKEIAADEAKAILQNIISLINKLQSKL